MRNCTHRWPQSGHFFYKLGHSFLIFNEGQGRHPTLPHLVKCLKELFASYSQCLSQKYLRSKHQSRRKHFFAWGLRKEKKRVFSRNSHPELFWKSNVSKYLVKPTGKYLCRSSNINEVARSVLNFSFFFSKRFHQHKKAQNRLQWTKIKKYA